jgi:nicotinamidase-related amidase
MHRKSPPSSAREHDDASKEVELKDETPHELPTEIPSADSKPSHPPRLSPTDLKKAGTDAALFSGELHDRIALLVIDMQETYRPLAEPLLPRLLPLITLCQSSSHSETSMVVFTQHGHSMAATQEQDGELGRFWGRENLIRKGTEEWELMSEIKPYAKRVLSKRHYDAFFDTNLHEILSFAGVTTVIVCGVLTNLCCETTARSAFVHDFSVWFLSDGTAARTAHMQSATESNLAYGFARVMTCEEAGERVRQRETEVLGSETHHLHGVPFRDLAAAQHQQQQAQST